MTSIATFSGNEIDFHQPVASEINLTDLGAGLSRAPRFAGQTTKHWTVAQHSLLVAHLVEPPYRLSALLHDAPEAYLCDMPTPAKRAMRMAASLRGAELSDYDLIETRLHFAVQERFKLPPAMIPAAVREADYLAMLIEAPRVNPLGWKSKHWDFAREHAEVFGETHHAVLRFHLIAALDQGGRYQWVMEVIGELSKRKVKVKV